MRVLRTIDRTVAVIEGALDAAHIRRFQETWSLVSTDPTADVLICLRGCEAIDGSGVALLVSLMRRTRNAGGSVRLKHVSGQPAALLRQLGIEQAFAA